MIHQDFYQYPYGAPDLLIEQEHHHEQESSVNTRPTYTADIVVIQRDHILLIKRRKWPYAGMWALPGGKQKSALEPLEQTTLRELHEATGLLPSLSRLVYVDCFDTPGRDPRGPFVSITYLVRLFSEECPTIQAGDDASEAQWFPLRNLPPLAFDHAQIIYTTLGKLARTVLTGRLVHDAFRYVEALTPLLGPWEELPEVIHGYYEEVARFLRERLLLCESCGWQQERAEQLHEVAGSLLCRLCTLPPPEVQAGERLIMREVTRQHLELVISEEEEPPMTEQALTFYTVLCDQEGYPVKYLDPTTSRVKTFRGPFDDPGEASQEFQACVGGQESCYLEPAPFQAKAQALAKLRRRKERQGEIAGKGGQK
jgi:8-oxo-dGTP diphosphatase